MWRVLCVLVGVHVVTGEVTEVVFRQPFGHEMRVSDEALVFRADACELAHNTCLNVQEMSRPELGSRRLPLVKDWVEPNECWVGAIAIPANVRVTAYTLAHQGPWRPHNCVSDIVDRVVLEGPTYRHSADINSEADFAKLEFSDDGDFTKRFCAFRIERIGDSTCDQKRPLTRQVVLKQPPQQDGFFTHREWSHDACCLAPGECINVRELRVLGATPQQPFLKGTQCYLGRTNVPKNVKMQFFSLNEQSWWRGRSCGSQSPVFESGFTDGLVDFSPDPAVNAKRVCAVRVDYDPAICKKVGSFLPRMVDTDMSVDWQWKSSHSAPILNAVVTASNLLLWMKKRDCLSAAQVTPSRLPAAANSINHDFDVDAAAAEMRFFALLQKRDPTVLRRLRLVLDLKLRDFKISAKLFGGTVCDGQSESYTVSVVLDVSYKLLPRPRAQSCDFEFVQADDFLRTGTCNGRNEDLEHWLLRTLQRLAVRHDVCMRALDRLMAHAYDEAY